jgi:hypothetical protein
MPNLNIGAVVDVETLKSGMQAGVEGVKSSTQAMAVSFEELSTQAARAVRQISEDTKLAATSISSDWVKAAEASAVYSKAQQEVRAASVLVKQTAGEDANALNLLAAAQQRAALATSERAIAQRTAAAADQAAALGALAAAEQTQIATLAQASAMLKIPVAAEEAGLGVMAAFRRMGAAVMEAAGVVRSAATKITAELAETAEASGLSAEGMTAAFSGFSKLLGVGIAVGFAAHFLEESAKVQVELKHLSEATGINITTLAGLRAVVQQAGADFQPFEVGLVRLERAQAMAIEGHKQQIQAFHRIGIEINELKSLTPEELFFRTAKAMEESKSSGDAATSAIALFGKGGAALLPIIREMGEALREKARIEGEASGITEHSAEAAAEWERMTAKLSQTFHSAMIPVLQAIIPVIKAVQTAFEVMATVLLTVFESVGTVIVAIGTAMATQAKLLYDVATGNFAAIPSDARAVVSKTVDAFTDGGREIGNNWKALGGELKGVWSKAGQDVNPLKADQDIPTGAGAGAGKDTRMAQWKEQLEAQKDALVRIKEMSHAEEAEFWADKLALARGNSKLYEQVFHEMRQAQRAVQQESLKDEMEFTREKLAHEKAGSNERIAIIREELNHLKSIGQQGSSEYKQLIRQEAEEVRANEEQKKRILLEAENTKIAATRSGTAERIRVLNEAIPHVAAAYGWESEQVQRLLTERIRAEQEFAQKSKEAQLIELEADRNHQVALLNDEKERINTAYQLHQINGQQKIALLKGLENQEFQIASQALQDKLELLKKDPTTSPEMLARAQAQIVALTDAHNHRILSLDSQSITEREKKYQQFFGQIGSGFANALTGMLQHSRSFTQGLAQTWNQMVGNFIQSLSRMLFQWLATLAVKVLAHFGAEQAITASAAAGASQRQGIGMAEHIKSIMRAAARAAAHGFKWVMEQVPFPVNVVLAPIVAAGAFAAVMGLGMLGVAEKGAVLDHDMPVFAHAKEMILPAHISQGLQGIISSGSGSRLSSITNNASSRMTRIHVAPEIHLHGPDAARMTTEEIASAVREGLRRGMIPITV